MPQRYPLFPEGATLINQNIGSLRQGTTIAYAYGNLPVFTHDVDDLASVRMFTWKLYINGSASQAKTCRAFGVCKIPPSGQNCIAFKKKTCARRCRSRATRVLVMLEQFAGVAYIAVVVSRLIGMTIVRQKG